MPTSWKTSLAIDAKLPWGIKGTLEGIFNQNFNEVYAIPLGFKLDGNISLPGEPANGREKWSVETNIPGNSKGFGYRATNVSGKGLNGRYYSITAQLSKDFGFLDTFRRYRRPDFRIRKHHHKERCLLT